jgi:UDP-glucose 4-epimerase
MSGHANQRLLITGGAGFIGSHLTDAYLARGATVYVLDDESTGSRQNLAHALDNPRLRFVHGSIMDEKLLARLVGTCNHVIHLAAAVGVQYILDNPLGSIMTNVVGSEHVLRFCAEFEKPLFLASTSEVYGLQTKAPLKEEDYCVLGATSVSRWSYACSKALDEFMALAYHGQGAFPVTIARLFNTVGPRQSAAYGMVIPRLVDQALANQPITVYGDGAQTRTFTHVADVVEAMIRLIDSAHAAGQVYNIGGIEEVSILQLAERIKRLTGSTSDIQLLPYRTVFGSNFEDMPRRVPDISKLRAAIDYAPKQGLDAILADVIASRRAVHTVAV